MNIVIADDHSIVRHGLLQIIASQPHWKVTAEVASADDVLPALRQVPADVLVLDVSLGGRSGIDVLVHVRAEFPSLPVLILSMHDESLYAVRCLRAGASGYIEKNSTADELVRAIERVASGHSYVSDVVADQLASRIAQGSTGQPHERLTAREFEVMRLLASGKTVTEVAVTLHLSVKTVSTYRTRIMDKTGFHSNAELMTYAIRTGLV